MTVSVQRRPSITVDSKSPSRNASSGLHLGWHERVSRALAASWQGVRSISPEQLSMAREPRQLPMQPLLLVQREHSGFSPVTMGAAQ